MYAIDAGTDAAAVDEPGDDDVFRKIREDFDNAGVDQSDDDIRTAMANTMKEAVEQIDNDQ